MTHRKLDNDQMLKIELTSVLSDKKKKFCLNDKCSMVAGSVFEILSMNIDSKIHSL